MSTAPTPHEPTSRAADRPGAWSGHAAAPAPRRGSGAVARLLTAVYALVMTPIATGLLAHGGAQWARYSFTVGGRAELSELLDSGLGVRILLALGLGLVLLASVLATGVVSSAGLVAVGVLGLGSIAVTLVPALLLQLYAMLPPFLPATLLEAVTYGLPLFLHPLLGGLGVALVIARRRPDPHVLASVAGFVLVPLALLVGAVLMFHGLTEVTVHAMRTADMAIAPGPAALCLVGVLLVWLCAVASRWSPYALVVPGLVMLVSTVAVIVPELRGLFHVLDLGRTGAMAMSFFAYGGGLAVGLCLLLHTAVLAVVRSRARRRPRMRAA